MKALLLSIFTVITVVATVLHTLVATGERVAVIGMAVKMPLMQVAFSICVIIVWFVFRAIERRLRRQR